MARTPDQAELDATWRDQGRLAVCVPALIVSVIGLFVFAAYLPRLRENPEVLLLVLAASGPLYFVIWASSFGPVYRAVRRWTAQG